MWTTRLPQKEKKIGALPPVPLFSNQSQQEKQQEKQREKLERQQEKLEKQQAKAKKQQEKARKQQEKLEKQQEKRKKRQENAENAAKKSEARKIERREKLKKLRLKIARDHLRVAQASGKDDFSSAGKDGTVVTVGKRVRAEQAESAVLSDSDLDEDEDELEKRNRRSDDFEERLAILSAQIDACFQMIRRGRQNDVALVVEKAVKALCKLCEETDAVARSRRRTAEALRLPLRAHPLDELALSRDVATPEEVQAEMSNVLLPRMLHKAERRHFRKLVRRALLRRCSGRVSRRIGASRRMGASARKCDRSLRGADTVVDAAEVDRAAADAAALRAEHVPVGDRTDTRLRAECFTGNTTVFDKYYYGSARTKRIADKYDDWITEYRNELNDAADLSFAAWRASRDALLSQPKPTIFIENCLRGNSEDMLRIHRHSGTGDYRFSGFDSYDEIEDPWQIEVPVYTEEDASTFQNDIVRFGAVRNNEQLREIEQFSAEVTHGDMEELQRALAFVGIRADAPDKKRAINPAEILKNELATMSPLQSLSELRSLVELDDHVRLMLDAYEDGSSGSSASSLSSSISATATPRRSVRFPQQKKLQLQQQPTAEATESDPLVGVHSVVDLALRSKALRPRFQRKKSVRRRLTVAPKAFESSDDDDDSDSEGS
ncbi:MAG: hypothetical protein MHM6MM_008500 [Cercozoa sp. M6MM]